MCIPTYEVLGNDKACFCLNGLCYIHLSLVSFIPRNPLHITICDRSHLWPNGSDHFSRKQIKTWDGVLVWSSILQMDGKDALELFTNHTALFSMSRKIYTLCFILSRWYYRILVDSCDLLTLILRGCFISNSNGTIIWLLNAHWINLTDTGTIGSLRWHHNERDCVSNHRCLDG